MVNLQLRWLKRSIELEVDGELATGIEKKIEPSCKSMVDLQLERKKWDQLQVGGRLATGRVKINWT